MSKKKFTINRPEFFLLFVALISVLLCTGVFAPLYTATNSDVMTRTTLIPIIVEAFFSILECAYISFLIATLSFTLYTSKTKTSNILFLSLGIVLIKALSNVVFVYLFDLGFYLRLDFTDFLSYLWVDLLGVSAYLLLEAATLIAVWMAGKIMCAAHSFKIDKIRKASKYLSDFSFDEHSDVYPFTSFLTFKNPILTPALIGAIVITGFTVLLNLFFDIFALHPSSSANELIEKIFSYIGDLFIGLLGYVLSYFSLIFALKNSPIGEKIHSHEITDSTNSNN